jgi:hypothetical protein
LNTEIGQQGHPWRGPTSSNRWFRALQPFPAKERGWIPNLDSKELHNRLDPRAKRAGASAATGNGVAATASLHLASSTHRDVEARLRFRIQI